MTREDGIRRRWEKTGQETTTEERTAEDKRSREQGRIAHWTCPV